MIEANIDLILIHRTSGVTDEVVNARNRVAGCIRHRIIVHDIPRNRIDTSGGNDVAWKGRSQIGPGMGGVRSGRTRIVDQNFLALIRKRMREVALALEGGGHGGRENRAAPPTCPFIVKEEKRAILSVVQFRNQYRTAK